MCSYLLVCEQSRQAVIIDPVAPLANRLANLVQGQGLTLLAVLDTHQHQDHQSARADLLALLKPEAAADDNLGWPSGQSEINCGQYRLEAVGYART
ncbi:MAG: hypothetical protein U5L01_14490 [Rheinheimera sp.]|nr:hypothetical protein [Rheinheimera sp.]